MTDTLTGNGTSSNPYLIENIGDFFTASDPEAHYKLQSNLDFDDYEVNEQPTIEKKEKGNKIRNGGLIIHSC